MNEFKRLDNRALPRELKRTKFRNVHIAKDILLLVATIKNSLVTEMTTTSKEWKYTDSMLNKSLSASQKNLQQTSEEGTISQHRNLQSAKA